MNNLQAMVMGLQLCLVGMFLNFDGHMAFFDRVNDGRIGYLFIFAGMGISLHAYFAGEPPSN